MGPVPPTLLCQAEKGGLDTVRAVFTRHAEDQYRTAVVSGTGPALVGAVGGGKGAATAAAAAVAALTKTQQRKAEARRHF